eukprot:CAMPEP_0174748742 /NCGR_PEP_ID=MMETSP1094-20130205/94155_1 /TAXON_ID=156173 /ORGANISM="Chrysochromulina brevifilum, Strain UTEX LB 985" /LENGTH=34 /DNA_ID= /DNA_START= /DNA_END= /DNA_ORIENTATION=
MSPAQRDPQPAATVAFGKASLVLRRCHRGLQVAD